MVDELLWLEMLLKGVAGGDVARRPAHDRRHPRLATTGSGLLALQPSATRRGRLLTWLMAAGGFLLSLIEIARAA
jgi:hypothetical protein